MTVAQIKISQRLLTCYMVNGENLQLLVLQDERCAIARDDEVLRIYANDDVEQAAMDFLELTRPLAPLKNFIACAAPVGAPSKRALCSA